LITVRDAVPGDPARLGRALGGLPLFARYGMTPAELEKNLTGALERGEGLVVAEAAEAELVGFAWFQSRGTFATGGYLRLIAVDAAWQAKQVGRALLDEVERRVGAVTRTLFLLVSDFNVAAQRFYESRGYTQAGRLARFVRDDIDELVYWKRLR
jgi:ribosomal protein S18 acetylase RimI-like enzyme